MPPDPGFKQTKPLPGSRPSPPADTHIYIVTLRASKEKASAKGRRALYEEGVAVTSKFQREFRLWLDRNGLAEQVSEIGDPTAFGLFSIRSTAEVADRIRALPEVESVSHDREDLGLIK